MATKDYAQEGVASYQYWGHRPIVGPRPIENINDDDDNSYYVIQGSGPNTIEATYNGTYEDKVQIGDHSIAEIKFITQFFGGMGLAPNYFKLGFKLQYWDTEWRTLYTQVLTLNFNEGKTTRNYTNGGEGFSNVKYIRLWVEWETYYFAGEGASATSRCFSLILNSAYYPDSGLRFKTNDGLIGIGKDTVAGTHKLRFYDGATVQGLPLQEVGSQFATKIRIYDGVDIKALTTVEE